MAIPVVSVVGRSGSGKTTLICNLIPLLKERGLRVATIKHDVHGITVDTPGKDTYQHAQAGADLVVLSSPDKIAVFEKVEQELTLDEVLSRVHGVDIVLIEGYKNNNKPKIEIFRSAVHEKPYCSKDSGLLAIVSDITPDLGVPVFALDDYQGLVMLIVRFVIAERPR